MSSPVVACDLDRTLIYSAVALGLTCPDHECPRLDVVETKDGRPLSFCTRRAGLILERLSGIVPFVPVTTRTFDQYRRIRLLDRPPAIAVVANGGHILVDGHPDPVWTRHVTTRIHRECAPLDTVLDHLRRIAGPEWLLRLHAADDLFCYLIIDRDRLPAGLLDELTAWCHSRRWSVSLQGRKLYCVPQPVTKWAAVAELLRRLDRDTVLAAGDSLLDQELLTRACGGIRPAHGELHDRGWHQDHIAVTVSAGVMAGEEIAADLLAEVDGSTSSGCGSAQRVRRSG
jgi:hypothetical protein